MPLTKARGNMYPWVTHTHAHIGGECPHRCSYCYVDSPRFGRPAKFTGGLRLLEAELNVDYGKGRTIFVDHCNDLFFSGVPLRWIKLVLGHCYRYPANVYVFQTKNPGAYGKLFGDFPPSRMLGCTIETNRRIAPDISQAPDPEDRYRAMRALRGHGPLFVTLEPIMDFDVDVLAWWLAEINPAFVNIGADSKGHGLPEPSAGKVAALISLIQCAGIEIRRKSNLSRLMGER
jgi:DNA repair photolyase